MRELAVRLLDLGLQVATLAMIVTLACIVLLGVGFRYSGSCCIQALVIGLSVRHLHAECLLVVCRVARTRFAASKAVDAPGHSVVPRV